jgi:hypothetical protein
MGHFLETPSPLPYEESIPVCVHVTSLLPADLRMVTGFLPADLHTMPNILPADLRAEVC